MSSGLCDPRAFAAQWHVGVQLSSNKRCVNGEKLSAYEYLIAWTVDNLPFVDDPHPRWIICALLALFVVACSLPQRVYDLECILLARLNRRP
jgi:hypothetical protein